jgi:hypothetical protein
VKNLVSYIIGLGNRLAANTEGDRCYRNSFKKGFASRIYVRALEEIKAAKSNGIVDEETGRSLVVAPLYNRSEAEIKAYLRNKGMRLHKKQSSHSISDANGYNDGNEAGKKVALRANGIGSGGSVGQIGH